MCEASRLCLTDSFVKNLKENSDAHNIAAKINQFLVERKKKPFLFADSTAIQEESKIVQRALNWIENGFSMNSLNYKLESPFMWNTAEKTSRNHKYKIQAWIMIDELLRASLIEPNDLFLKTSRKIALDWIDEFLLGDSTDEFCWYDMGTGQRASLLAYITQKSILTQFDRKRSRSKTKHDFTNEKVLKLIISAEIHMLELLSEDRLASHSNHGLFQMAGLLALSNSLPMLKSSEKAETFAIDKIELMLNDHFFKDGFHKEHSPMYHIFMSNYLYQLRSAGWLEKSSVLESLCDAAVRASQKYIMPNGYLVPLGDSNMKYRADELCIFNVNLDKNEIPSCPPGLHVFKEGGVVILAANDSGVADEHLVLSAQFHSRQHKHADDLSINYSINGEPYLIDAGTFTYHYDQKERKYVESTKAHNTMEFDGMNYSRFRLDAYGSALSKTYQIGDCTIIEAQIVHKSLVPNNIANNNIKTTDKKIVNISHERILIHKQNSFLAVIDLVDSHEKHQFAQWFHLDPKFNALQVEENVIQVTDEKTKPHSNIYFKTYQNESSEIEIYRGENSGELIGWHSTDGTNLVPNCSISNRSFGHSEQFCTVFSQDPKSKTPFININDKGRYIRFSNKSKMDLVDITIRRKAANRHEVRCFTNGEEFEKIFTWE